MNRWALLLCAASAAFTSSAFAQSDSNLIPASRNFWSPERFILELRGGPYSPDAGDNPAFDQFFGGDSGPFLGFQLSYILFRVPDIAYLAAGGGLGWINFTGAAVAQTTGERVGEETDLTLLPLLAVASVRIDVLPRKLKLPFILVGKLGFEWAHWDTDTGARSDASGWSVGPLFGAQLAIDLDTFEPAAARSMDEEWGINHSSVFVEVYHFAATDDSLPVGGTAWVAGLGFNF